MLPKLIVGIAIVGLVLAFVSGSNTRTPDPVATYTPQIGEDAQVRSTGTGTTVAAAVARNDYEDLWYANTVKDQMGVQALWNSGRMFSLPNGTRVHIVFGYSDLWQVRILQGTHRGELAWVTRTDLAP